MSLKLSDHKSLKQTALHLLLRGSVIVCNLIIILGLSFLFIFKHLLLRNVPT